MKTRAMAIAMMIPIFFIKYSLEIKFNEKTIFRLYYFTLINSTSQEKNV
uniref:Uncharacterized protein n=1 Tax=uncultured bacterium contig00059 TaxID=1181542 RepID=A0A0A6ZH57_9BACT|nr:hypothetical protein [uncultured bacterium contig00059]